MKNIIILALISVVSACTVSTQKYAVFSTKEAGVFYAEAQQDRKKEDVVTLENSNTTKLEALVATKESAEDHTKYALVVGIENYKQQAKVNYAKNSARTFALAAKNILGVPSENIIYLTDGDATSGQLKTQIQLIKQLVEPGDSLYFYFAGHGVPGNDGNTYLLPSDMGADAIHLEPQLMLDRVYETLNDSMAERVYVYIDSCFSGKDDVGELLYKGVAPVFKRQNKQFSSSKLTIMTAGGPSDFANQYEKENQRLFSYYLIKGLMEKKEDVGSLYHYVRKNVKKASLRIGLGYKQIPKLQMSDDGKT